MAGLKCFETMALRPIGSARSVQRESDGKSSVSRITPRKSTISENGDTIENCYHGDTVQSKCLDVSIFSFNWQSIK